MIKSSTGSRRKIRATKGSQQRRSTRTRYTAAPYASPGEDAQWVRNMIQWYDKTQRHYEDFGLLLDQIMQQAIRRRAPLAIVQVRAKKMSSFAEKLWRKLGKYRLCDNNRNPLHPLTDLCGVRVICQTPKQKASICRFVEKHFDIDWENSGDKIKALRAHEFGYLSYHYIVSLRPDVFPSREFPVNITSANLRRFAPLCAEIQVRTFLEHAWADINHDISYKSSFLIPKLWQREFARAAALLENVDAMFTRIQAGLATYAANYTSYMSKEEIRQKMEEFTIVHETDPNDTELAHRIAKLAMSLGNWRTVITVLLPFASSGSAALLRDLGVAMCKHYKQGSRNYKRGQKYLEEAIAANPQDQDAISSLGGTWKGVDEDKAYALYQQAFSIDPADPYALGNYLEYEISRHCSRELISLALPSLDKAILRCRDQAAVGINLPWCYYDLAKFQLLLEKPYEALQAYTKAVAVSASDFMVQTSLDSVQRLCKCLKELPGSDWITRYLNVVLANMRPAHLRSAALKSMRHKKNLSLRKPVVILAGASDSMEAKKEFVYGSVMNQAFSDFNGTLISGGTRTGVGELAGSIGALNPETVLTIGYVPCLAPTRIPIDRNPKRYRHIVCSDGTNFSPLEPLQMWFDLRTAGIPAAAVRMLGIGGGDIAALEYSIALSLGATLAVLEGSGGAAAEILRSPYWHDCERLIELPVDAEIVREFVHPLVRLPESDREPLGMAIHESYRKSQAGSIDPDRQSLMAWDKLREDLRESNRQQADHIQRKLSRMGYRARKSRKKTIKPMSFKRPQLELMAEMEHARWTVERLLAGWRYGAKKDVENKISPYLISWRLLAEDVKDWDRKAVREIPDLLAQFGWEIVESGNV